MGRLETLPVALGGKAAKRWVEKNGAKKDGAVERIDRVGKAYEDGKKGGDHGFESYKEKGRKNEGGRESNE